MNVTTYFLDLTEVYAGNAPILGGASMDCYFGLLSINIPELIAMLHFLFKWASLKIEEYFCHYIFGKDTQVWLRYARGNLGLTRIFIDPSVLYLLQRWKLVWC